MTEQLHHAALAFALAGAACRIGGAPLSFAFIAVIASLLVDLDRTLSPSPSWDRSLHSPYALCASVLSAPFLALIDEPMAFLPLLGTCAHLLMDALSGEDVCLIGPNVRPVRRRPRGRDPRLTRALRGTAILACLALLFV